MAYWLFSITKMIGSFHRLGHVEGLVDLALVGRAVAEIGQRSAAVLVVLVREGEAVPSDDLRADDAVAAVELLLGREHVHRAALAAADAGLRARSARP